MYSNRQLRIIQWNANSVQNKRAELNEFLNRMEVDIVAISETFLDNNSTLHLRGFKTYRSDRDSRGGGVSISIRHNITHRHINNYTTRSLENVNIVVETTQGSIRVSSVYCPKYTRHFKEDIRTLTSGHSEYVIVGDLNARHTSWNCVGQNPAGKFFSL